MLFLDATVSSELASYNEQLVMITKRIERFSSNKRESVLGAMGRVCLLMKFRVL